MSFDFALLFLSNPMELNHRAYPACLPPPYMGGHFLEGKMLTVSGWGHTTYRGQLSNVLMAVNVTGISNIQCAKVYYYRPIHDNNVCTYQEGGKDSCQGDSGGNFASFYS